MTVAETLQAHSLFDVPVLRHGFSPSGRDYHVFTRPVEGEEKRYRFTHCVVAEQVTVLSDDVWSQSWDDVFLDPEAWSKAGHSAGHVWGVNWAESYPGLTHHLDSKRAENWSERLGREMHEVTLETNLYLLRLIFHSVKVTYRGEE